MNHTPCHFENKHFGAWERVRKPFPYGWFFNYYELRSGGSVYFDRKNKLDRLFDWVCKYL